MDGKQQAEMRLRQAAVAERAIFSIADRVNNMAIAVNEGRDKAGESIALFRTIADIMARDTADREAVQAFLRLGERDQTDIVAAALHAIEFRQKRRTRG